MPAAKRRGHEGRRAEWPWDDRGRSAVTRESVERDIADLSAWLTISLLRAAGLVRL